MHSLQLYYSESILEIVRAGFGYQKMSTLLKSTLIDRIGLDWIVF